MMRVAIIGGGQLARMLALAGWPLGIRFAFLVQPDEATDCIDGLGEVVVQTPDASPHQLFLALGSPAVITIEREAVDAALLHALAQHCPVYPDPAAVYECQNRRRQKSRLQQLDIPNTPHRFAHDGPSLRDAVDALGWPVVVKAAEHGYDGKNQWRLHSAAMLEDFLSSQPQGDWVVESLVRFEREISLLAVRDRNGGIALYPATENHHIHGVLRSSVAPATIPQDAVADMQHALARLLQHWHYVGVLAMECFVTEAGLLVNELAPRVHNSGHWTQQAPVASQFENHLRAICGWPLGNTRTPLHSAMLNLVGIQANHAALAPHATLHWYNKAVRPGRKLGHINLQHPDRTQLVESLRQLEQQLYPT